MARLPNPGSDAGEWGEILNDFLEQVHQPDGTLKDDTVSSSTLSAGAVNAGAIEDGSVTKPKLSSAVQGSLDKADTALQSAPVSSVNSQTGAVELDKADVGLGNADNTSDLGKPISTAAQTALDDKVSHTSTYTVAGAAEGYNYLLNLDYDATSGSIPEAFMVKARNTSDVLTKAFWLNEAGQPRIWTVFKDEPALKAFGFGVNGSGKVLTVQDRWNGGGAVRWGVNGKGQQVLGPNEVSAGAVVVLGALDPLPSGLPDGTLIVRTN